MVELRTDHGSGLQGRLRPLLPHAAVIAVGGPLVVLLVSLTPPPLLLPVVSLATVALAGVMALLGWMRGERWNADRLTSWDVAAAFAFIGSAAAMLSQPETVMDMLGDSSIP